MQRIDSEGIEYAEDELCLECGHRCHCYEGDCPRCSRTGTPCLTCVHEVEEDETDG